MPCMAHVINLAIQGGLQELGSSSLTSFCLESEGDEECEEDEVEVTEIPDMVVKLTTEGGG